MARLIDADALCEVLIEAKKGAGALKPIYDALLAVVDLLPAIEAEPVRHGHWKWNIAKTRPFCSECAEEPYRASNNRLPNFCPNCGARMDGGNDNE